MMDSDERRRRASGWTSKAPGSGNTSGGISSGDTPPPPFNTGTVDLSRSSGGMFGPSQSEESAFDRFRRAMQERDEETARRSVAEQDSRTDVQLPSTATDFAEQVQSNNLSPSQAAQAIERMAGHYAAQSAINMDEARKRVFDDIESRLGGMYGLLPDQISPLIGFLRPSNTSSNSSMGTSPNANLSELASRLGMTPDSRDPGEEAAQRLRDSSRNRQGRGGSIYRKPVVGSGPQVKKGPFGTEYSTDKGGSLPRYQSELSSFLSSDQIKELGELTKEMATRKVFGKPVYEIVMGILATGYMKAGFGLFFATAGIGGLALPIAAASAAGGVWGAGSEYVHQFFENMDKSLIVDPKDKPLTDSQREQLKVRIRDAFRPNDPSKLLKAFAKGATFGAVGGLAGTVVMEFVASNFYGAPSPFSDTSSLDQSSNEMTNAPATGGGSEGVSSPQGAEPQAAPSSGPSASLLAEDARKAALEAIASSRQPTELFTGFPQSITIDSPGDTIFKALDVAKSAFANGLEHGWINSVNGITQEDVIRDLVGKFAESNGVNVNNVHVGDTYELSKILTQDQLDVVKKALETKDAADYWNNVRPQAQAVMGAGLRSVA